MNLSITLLTGKWSERIVVELVRAGYQVTKGFAHELTLESECSSILTLKVTKVGSADFSPSDLATQVQDILHQLNASYFSLICYQGSSCHGGGTIFTPTQAPPNPRPQAVESLLSEKDDFDDF